MRPRARRRNRRTALPLPWQGAGASAASPFPESRILFKGRAREPFRSPCICLQDIRQTPPGGCVRGRAAGTAAQRRRYRDKARARRRQRRFLKAASSSKTGRAGGSASTAFPDPKGREAQARPLRSAAFRPDACPGSNPGKGRGRLRTPLSHAADDLRPPLRVSLRGGDGRIQNRHAAQIRRHGAQACSHSCLWRPLQSFCKASPVFAAMLSASRPRCRRNSLVGPMGG